ncbi:MAG: acylphosphatase [Ancalomicrobiaceae bacterium]|nr:acylphosphatase [Ancalomicrobiaceae bacterium]
MTVRVVILGDVQGVGFRWWMTGQAKALELDGYVRNRRDGTVEAVMSGPDRLVEAMIRACRIGPPGAEVLDVVVEPWTAAVPDGFIRLRTE